MTTLTGQPYRDGHAHEIADAFAREGCALVPGVLNPEEAAGLRDKTDYYFRNRDSIPQQHVSYVGKTFVLRRAAELDQLYGDIITREPLPSIAAAILGPEPRFNASNVIRNEHGQAIDNWHVDDTLEHPLPEDIPRFDARIRMPVLWFTVQVALSDIDALANGPTQYVPGSHYSGRRPPPGDDPTFDGQGPKAVLCKAGDIYLTNHQAWHRGSPNTSDRVRFVMQVQYAARWAEARFRGAA